jgi:hypothetical protein
MPSLNVNGEQARARRDDSNAPTGFRPATSLPTTTAGAITNHRSTTPRIRIEPESLLLATARYAPWTLAVLFLAVSMPHLSSGFQSITGCSVITGWLMAVAIDCAQVTSKLQLTLAGKLDVGSSAKRTALAIILASTGLSMTLNVLGFSAHVEEVGGGRIGVTLAWVAGILLPLLILGLSYSGSAYCLAKEQIVARTSVGQKAAKRPRN